MSVTSLSSRISSEATVDSFSPNLGWIQRDLSLERARSKMRKNADKAIFELIQRLKEQSSAPSDEFIWCRFSRIVSNPEEACEIQRFQGTGPRRIYADVSPVEAKPPKVRSFCIGTCDGGVLAGIADGLESDLVSTYTSEQFPKLFEEGLQRVSEVATEVKIHAIFEEAIYRLQRVLDQICKDPMWGTFIVCYVNPDVTRVYTATIGNNEAFICRKISKRWEFCSLSSIREPLSGTSRGELEVSSPRLQPALLKGGVLSGPGSPRLGCLSDYSQSPMSASLQGDLVLDWPSPRQNSLPTRALGAYLSPRSSAVSTPIWGVSVAQQTISIGDVIVLASKYVRDSFLQNEGVRIVHGYQVKEPKNGRLLSERFVSWAAKKMPEGEKTVIALRVERDNIGVAEDLDELLCIEWDTFCRSGKAREGQNSSSKKKDFAIFFVERGMVACVAEEGGANGLSKWIEDELPPRLQQAFFENGDLATKDPSTVFAIAVRSLAISEGTSYAIAYLDTGKALLCTFTSGECSAAIYRQQTLSKSKLIPLSNAAVWGRKAEKERAQKVAQILVPYPAGVQVIHTGLLEKVSPQVSRLLGRVEMPLVSKPKITERDIGPGDAIVLLSKGLMEVRGLGGEIARIIGRYKRHWVADSRPNLPEQILVAARKRGANLDMAAISLRIEEDH